MKNILTRSWPNMEMPLEQQKNRLAVRNLMAKKCQLHNTASS
jgi:hypothetical protein